MRAMIQVCVAVCVAVCALNSSATAHELTSNTARLTLRDNHVSIRADVDLLSWMARRTKASGDLIPALASLPPAQREAMLAPLREALIKDSALTVNGEEVPLRLLTFPDNQSLQRAAHAHMLSSPKDHVHPILFALRMEAVTTTPEADTVALTLPKDMGPVLVNFVQPSTQWTHAGAPATFHVLAAPGLTHKASAPTESADTLHKHPRVVTASFAPWLVGLLVSLSGLSFALFGFWRRSGSPHSSIIS